MVIYSQFFHRETDHVPCFISAAPLYAYPCSSRGPEGLVCANTTPVGSVALPFCPSRYSQVLLLPRSAEKPKQSGIARPRKLARTPLPPPLRNISESRLIYQAAFFIFAFLEEIKYSLKNYEARYCRKS